MRAPNAAASSRYVPEPSWSLPGAVSTSTPIRPHLRSLVARCGAILAGTASGCKCFAQDVGGRRPLLDGLQRQAAADRAAQGVVGRRVEDRVCAAARAHE